jgi:hypothetical protein
MKITGYQLLKEDIINKIISADQKQDAINNSLKDIGFGNKEHNVEKHEEPIQTYKVEMFLVSDKTKAEGEDFIKGVFTVSFSHENTLLTFKNKDNLIKMKLVNPIIGKPEMEKQLRLKYVNGYIDKEGIEKKYKTVEFITFQKK